MFVGIDPFHLYYHSSYVYGYFPTQIHEEEWEILTGDDKKKTVLENRKPIWEKAIRKNYVFSVSNIVEKRFIKSDIGIVPTRGYTSDIYSKESIEWLSWVAHENKIEIQHALNGGEMEIIGPNGKITIKWMVIANHQIPYRIMVAYTTRVGSAILISIQ